MSYEKKCLNKYFSTSLTKNFLEISWKPKAQLIEYKTFFECLKFLAEIILEYEPDFLLVDFENVGLVLNEEDQENVIEIIVPAHKQAQVKKLAVNAGKDFIKLIFLEQIMKKKEREIKNFHAKVFKDKQNAIKWLMAEK